MAEIKNLSKLVIAVIDEFSCLERRQELLRICQEELSNPSEDTPMRVELLIGSYLADAENHFNQLNWYLKDLQCCLKQLTALSAELLE